MIYRIHRYTLGHFFFTTPREICDRYFSFEIGPQRFSAKAACHPGRVFCGFPPVMHNNGQIKIPAHSYPLQLKPREYLEASQTSSTIPSSELAGKIKNRASPNHLIFLTNLASRCPSGGCCNIYIPTPFHLGWLTTLNERFFDFAVPSFRLLLAAV